MGNAQQQAVFVAVLAQVGAGGDLQVEVAEQRLATQAVQVAAGLVQRQGQLVHPQGGAGSPGLGERPGVRVAEIIAEQQRPASLRAQIQGRGDDRRREGGRSCRGWEPDHGRRSGCAGRWGSLGRLGGQGGSRGAGAEQGYRGKV